MNNVVWKYQDEPIHDELIDNVTKKIDFSFPRDYVDCVKLNQGGSPSPYIFEVEGMERVFGSLLKFNKPDSATDMLNLYERYKLTLPKEVIAFGNDPSGNLICFDYKDCVENPIVVFWEHEDAWEKQELMKNEGITAEQAEEVARENIFYIADTFTEFLDKLHD